MQGLEAVRLELARLLLDKIELVGARVQDSVGLLFHCRTSTAFHRLDRRFETGTLRALLNTIFNALLVKDTIEVAVYKLSWHEDVFQQALKHFDGTGKYCLRPSNMLLGPNAMHLLLIIKRETIFM